MPSADIPQPPPTRQPTVAARSWLPFAMAALVAVALGWLTKHWFLKQHELSMDKPSDWGHAYLVPLIAGYAVWKSWRTLRRVQLRVYWPGALVLALGIVCFSFFVLSFSNHMFQGCAIVLMLFGTVLLALGPHIARLLSFPIGYLLFGITISEQVMNTMTFPLQRLAVFGSNILLNMLSGIWNYTATRSGNTITIVTAAGETHPLNVAQACSGMRMVVAFIALGVAVAFLSCKLWWQRFALLFLTVPIAVFMNVLRVASLGIASLYNPDLIAGDAHVLIGTLWLAPGLLLFMASVWALQRAVRDTPPSASSKPKGTSS